MNSNDYMQEAIKLAQSNIESGDGGPFGAIVVFNNEIIGRGKNEVLKTKDPTAHAEIQAIRAACKKLNQYHLTDCILYATCEPCPMCLSTIYWAHIKKVYFAATRHDAANIGFIDEELYQELNKKMDQRKIHFEQITHPQAKKIFTDWQSKFSHSIY